jgi:hypothetical protein
MSTVQPNRSMVKLAEDTFTAIVITDSRMGVLAALTQQAVEHFGGGPLILMEVSVVTCEMTETPNTKILACALIAQTD